MEELTKFLKFLVISNLLFILLSCEDAQEKTEIKSTVPSDSVITKPMTKEDSIYQLADELNVVYDKDNDNINDVLDKILLTKKNLLLKLDSLSARADKMELAAISYKKKENEKIRKKLLSEIDRIKAELERIKKMSGITDETIVTEKNKVPEVVIPDVATTFENLPSGNYTVRLDKYYIISVFVTKESEIIVGKPKLDSTTVFKSNPKIDSRIAKELKQIKEEFNGDLR